MECVECGSAATSARRDRTAQGHRRFRCRDCGREFNERSGGALNRTQYPSDVIALVVLWRLRYRLTLQDLSEMFLQRGIAVTRKNYLFLGSDAGGQRAAVIYTIAQTAMLNGLDPEAYIAA
ncbi:MAG: hypothetical protein JO143_03180, partial [Acetobacteraceae bacterium]|nr:hypothetical protein [Acetobacteraceae bacterium]